MKRPLPTALACLALLACPEPEAKREVEAQPTRAPSPGPRESPAADAGAGEQGERAGPVRFLAIGGGTAPESTEVSMEQDIEQVLSALRGPGRVLFAGGSRSMSVRELADEPRGDALRVALGDLFSPRSGRHSRYRRPRLSARPAHVENVEAQLDQSLSRGGPPLLVYVAAHGDQGASTRENAIALWGGHALTVARLAELHEQRQRGLRLVATSCFSGGFAELAFAGADATRVQPSPVPRCGLFAGTFDRETSGCDPNPDRRAQESYGLHFVHALSGRGRDGARLEPSALDFDGNGRVGLLDAHTWARIEAVSVDVPTTTSERWLRAVQERGADIDPTAAPEDAAVVSQLGRRLGLTSEAAAEQRWHQLDRQLTELGQRVRGAEDELADTEADLGMLLVERWPELDDAYHPNFDATLKRHRAPIERALTQSREARLRARRRKRVAKLRDALDRASVEEARVLRLVRAYETLHLASALAKRGGPAAAEHARLLACERAVP